jgi:hypothetical protein
MVDLLPILLSAIIVCALVILISKKISLSSRYERKPRKRSLWSAQDHGIDLTDESNNERS